ncbi:hypothetical protein BU204_13750 [Actinophytocola xanthii]|uniref:Uncharacterized protein n=1 Tax=Actinophytocola xanthii TaxID=1912961 RepID=A0A1Q8CRK4_9PSEU|nr:hypothetical protein BU204_13750 [Actinophytocola xanthii]
MSAALFLGCGLLTLIVSVIAMNESGFVESASALVGAKLFGGPSGDRNLGLTIGTSMTAACTALTFALLLFARFDVARRVLGILGAVVAAYYLFSIFSRGSLRPIVLFLLWAAPTVLVLLPSTGRAMRGYQRRLFGPGPAAGPGGGPYGGVPHAGGYGHPPGGGHAPPGGYRPY